MVAKLPRNWFALAAGSLANPGSILNLIAKAHHAAPSQIAVAVGSQAEPDYAPHSPWEKRERGLLVGIFL